MLHKCINNNVEKTNFNQNFVSKLTPLGNLTNYSANLTNIDSLEVNNFKYQLRKDKIVLKNKLSAYGIPRVYRCGTIPIDKDIKHVQLVQGQKDNIYYSNMQRCGSVWMCPDCMYKIMKERADNIYRQLTIHKAEKKTVLFVTFTTQHKKHETLKDVKERILKAFNFANTSRAWKEKSKQSKVEFLRVLEVLHGLNGWHPHLHCVFIGNKELINDINTFVRLYKEYLNSKGQLINDYTTKIDKWNGSINDMSEYLFKGKLELELIGGNLKTQKHGNNFFDLVRKDESIKVKEFIFTMKGARQFHHSKNFFTFNIKNDREILKDDTIKEVLFNIPIDDYKRIRRKGIALSLINEYIHKGNIGIINLLELYKLRSYWIVPEI